MSRCRQGRRTTVYTVPVAVLNFKVIRCRLKGNMRLPISDQQQPKPYLLPFSHSTSVTHKQTTHCAIQTRFTAQLQRVKNGLEVHGWTTSLHRLDRSSKMEYEKWTTYLNREDDSYCGLHAELKRTTKGKPRHNSRTVTSLIWSCYNSDSKRTQWSPKPTTQPKRKKAQLSLEQPTVLVVSDLQNHPGSMIFILPEQAYATSYQ